MESSFAKCLYCGKINPIKTVYEKVLCSDCGKIVKCGLMMID
jgi:predicted RNA-binding Zn-ribbon protein involved in translation (DUF1610 family)